MKNIKEDFYFFETNSNLIYFDNAATTLKPKQVIDQEMFYLKNISSNPHTNDYKNAFLANEMIDNSRQMVAKLINAPRKEEIIFTSGTTQSLNQVAFGLKKQLSNDDEILTTSLEHSANLLPWIIVAKQTNSKVKQMDLDENFGIDIPKLKKQINNKTKIVTFAHVSNTLGYENDVKKIATEIKKINPQTIIVVDVAQSIAHSIVDVQQWGVDFIAFSAHKIYGPFGLGVLWGRCDLLNQLEPLLYGGGMSKAIDKNLIDYKLYDLPDRLEAGTPNVPAIVGFAKAIEFVLNLGIKNIKEHEQNLKQYLINQIKQYHLEDKIDFYNLNNLSPLLTFNVKGINPQDMATFLDVKYNIASRSGSHCARRTSQVMNTTISLRVSFAIYNTTSEIDVLIKALRNSDNFLDAVL